MWLSSLLVKKLRKGLAAKEPLPLSRETRFTIGNALAGHTDYIACGTIIESKNTPSVWQWDATKDSLRRSSTNISLAYPQALTYALMYQVMTNNGTPPSPDPLCRVGYINAATGQVQTICVDLLIQLYTNLPPELTQLWKDIAIEALVLTDELWHSEKCARMQSLCWDKYRLAGTR